MKHLGSVTVDLRDLPSGAFRLSKGSKGEYYQCDFDLGLTFGPELIFEFWHGQVVIKRISADYKSATMAIPSNRTRTTVATFRRDTEQLGNVRRIY